MYEYIATINILAFTVPISFRLAMVLGDWFDGKFEDWQRKQ